MGRGDHLRLLRLALVVAGLLWLMVPQGLPACPVCYGANDSPMAAGLNAAIFTLLGITGVVLAGIAAFFFYLRKRSKVTLNGSVDPPSMN